MQAHLLAEPPPPPAYRLYATRWFVLFFFSLSNCNQCLSWFSFSSLDLDVMQKYFGSNMDKAAADLLLNWGPIIGAACAPLQTWMLSQPRGLRKGTWCGILLVFFGNLLRSVPILAVTAFGAEQSFVQSSAAFYCYHGGQILNAAAGPFLMGATSRLACVWFGEHERTTATAIATTANAAGTTIGFLNPIWLSPTEDTIPNIFWLSLGLAALSAAGAACYLQVAPPTPPSAAAEASPEELPEAAHATTDEGGALDAAGAAGAERPVGWLASLRSAGGSFSFVVLVGLAAILSGVACAWQALFQSVLAGKGGPLKQADVGWIGFGNALAGNVAAVLSGLVMDRWLGRRLKLGIMVGLMGGGLCTGWFALQLPLLSFGRLLPRSTGSLIVAVTLEGFFYGLTSPLFYELGAELVYPVREGTSAGLLVLLLNLTSGLMIFLNNFLPGTVGNLIMTVAFFACLLCIALCVREEYKRPLDQPRRPKLVNE